MEKIQELLKDEAFVKKLMNTEEPEDAQALFEENGVTLSLDEVKEIAAVVERIASGEISAEAVEKAANGELNESDLEEVAGGIVPLLAFYIGCTAAATIGASVGTTVGILSVVKRWRW